jgi:serine protease Do
MVTRRITAVLLVLGLSACRSQQSASAQQVSAVPPSPRAQPTRPIDAQRRTAIVDASEKVSPSVVSIHVILPTARQMSFFGIQEETPQGFGTGFIFRADGSNGYIITNNHVIENATQITVTLADGTDADGTVLGADPVTDIAVVKISKSGLPVVTLGKSSDLMIGEWAIALGNPYAYLLGNSEPTVTAGVISATHRNIMSGGGMQGVYVGMIQTDAAINPGNSGGPLVNALGEVIGVNSSIFSNTGESVGLGFSIPIERAARVANDIIATGTVHRAWPGLDVVTSGNLTDHKANGVQVRSVVPGGPADRAGIKAGDTLITANERPLRTYLDWEAAKLDLNVGDVITVGVKSGTAVAENRIVTGDLPTVAAARVQVLKGMELVTVTAAVRAERNVTNQYGGAVVVQIKPDIAAQTGIQKDDVIFAINQQPLKTADEVAAALSRVPKGQPFTLHLERNGRDAPVQLRMNQ